MISRARELAMAVGRAVADHSERLVVQDTWQTVLQESERLRLCNRLAFRLLVPRTRGEFAIGRRVELGDQLFGMVDGKRVKMSG